MNALRDYAAIANKYRKDVASGAIVSCKWLRLACDRQARDLERARVDPEWPYVWDAWHAADVCAFIEALPHVEGDWGTPEIVLEPWQVFLLSTVFGWRRRADGHRRFNTVYWEIARKNAKSTIGAAVCLYCLTCEGEVGPQVKCAATTGSQARIIFDIAKKMVNKTSDLAEEFTLETFASAIVCHEVAGSMQPINAKASTQDGLNPHLSMLDELHAHKDRGLFDVLKSARGARKNPLSWYVTTAGYDVEGVCFEQRVLLTKILEGIIEADHYFGVIYTLDEDDDELEEANWPKANPNYGVSLQKDEMRSYASEARMSADSLAEFKTKRCNIWLTAAHTWVPMDKWRKCAGTVDLEELGSLPCYGGLDLAATSDINALVFAWRVLDRVQVWCRFYVPEDMVAPRTERGNVPYQRWVKSGHLIATPGNVTDYAYIEKDIDRALARFNILEIGYDEWNSSDLVNRLVDKEAPMVPVRQGPKTFAQPMRELDRMVKGQTLEHGDNPVLTWMASNLVARRDVNDNLAPDRKKSHEKIDGMVAFLNALSRMMVHEDEAIAVPDDYEIMTA